LISPLLRSRQPPIFSPSNDISPKRTREIFNNWCRMASPAALSARGRLSGTTISTQMFLPVVARGSTLMGRTGRPLKLQPRCRRANSDSPITPWNFRW
jgi:hypothetical protein